MNFRSRRRKPNLHPITDAILLACLLATALVPLACTASEYSQQADASANRIMNKSQDQVLGDRKDTVIYPDMKPEETAPAESVEEEALTVPADESTAPRKIALKDALEIAFEQNRDYLNQKESLLISALNLMSTRHAFTPQLSAVLSYIFSDGSDVARIQDTGLGFGLSQLLTTGGTLSMDANARAIDISGTRLQNERNYTSSIGVNLSQPLLRGAGKEVAYESLVQGERNMVYAVRNFELYRQSFSIDVAQEYYTLVGRMRQVANERLNIDSVEFSRRQAEAFFKVGDTTELDYLRARRSELNSLNSLIEAEQALQEDIDRFKVFLGMPTTARIEIVPTEPDFIPVDYEMESAIEVALSNRLDYLNQQEQLEDAERSVRISKNSLLPDLDLNLGYNLRTSKETAGFSNQRLDSSSYTAGMTLDIPLDRVQEKINYRQTQIFYDQAVRTFDEYRDNLIIGIRSSFRALKRQQQSLEIQLDLIKDQEKNVRIAQIRFDLGELPNRDLLEAQKSLLDARNSLIEEQVSYEITRLRLLRELGILFVDDKGVWVE